MKHCNECNTDKPLDEFSIRNREWFTELKKTLSCEHCGEDHPAVLQFHHTDPSKKELGVSDMINQGSSRRRVQNEIAKCDVLCANCHFKLHYNLRQIA